MTQEISIYEFAGGAPAWHRFAAEHYRICLTDPVLNEVFGTTGHPEHVVHLAAWLGEVFGGPAAYTERYGGHSGILRGHAGKAITEEQRQRFVAAFMEAADAAELPADARFRQRLHDYVEWGSKVAKAVSKPDADLTTHEPVPRWGWE